MVAQKLRDIIDGRLLKWKRRWGGGTLGHVEYKEKLKEGGIVSSRCNKEIEQILRYCVFAKMETLYSEGWISPSWGMSARGHTTHT